jgi:hypothetical protein
MSEFDPTSMSGTLDTTEIGGAPHQRIEKVATVFEQRWSDSENEGVADAETQFHKKREAKQVSWTMAKRRN